MRMRECKSRICSGVNRDRTHTGRWEGTQERSLLERASLGVYIALGSKQLVQICANQVLEKY